MMVRRRDKIEKFSAMKSDAEVVRRSEKVLFRSFLLENGIQDLNDLMAQLEGSRPARVEGREKV